MTNDDAKYREKEAEWISVMGQERWSKLSKRGRDFLIKTAGAIELGPPEEVARSLKAIEDDEAGKYREWWEKLKSEMLEDQKSEDEVSDFLAKTTGGIMVRRMLQIEAGK